MKKKKNSQEIERMKIAGRITAVALKKVRQNIKPNILCTDLEKIAKSAITRSFAKPSFTTVKDYKWATCITLNSQVVHGIPKPIKLKEGDIISVDTGAIYKGLHSDMAITVPVGKVPASTRRFLEIGKKTLAKAIAQAQIGAKIGDISATIQQNIESAGYAIVKSLTGHGIGYELHEEPMVPGFGKRGTGAEIKEGMTLAIEVIYTQGSGEVYLEKDGWTVTTQDGFLAGLYEQTIAVTRKGPIVLTPYL